MLHETVSNIMLDMENNKENLRYKRLLSAEEEKILFKAVRSKNIGENQRLFLTKLLALLNMGLVRKSVLTLSQPNERNDNGNELLQVLMRQVIPKFDYRLNNKFSTYAAPWIKQTIKRSKQKNRLISIAANVQDNIAILRKTRSQLRNTMNREPTDYELALEANRRALTNRFPEMEFSDDALAAVTTSKKFQVLNIPNLPNNDKHYLNKHIVSPEHAAKLLSIKPAHAFPEHMDPDQTLPDERATPTEIGLPKRVPRASIK